MPIASIRNHRDEREALLPPPLLPLFDERFVVSCDLLEEYSGIAAIRDAYPAFMVAAIVARRA